MKIISVNKDELSKLLISESSNYVLVDFYATWCTPCKTFSSTLNIVNSKKIFPSLNIVSLDIGSYPDVATKYSVFSVPTLILFKKTINVAFTSGLLSEEKLVKWLNLHIL